MKQIKKGKKLIVILLLITLVFSGCSFNVGNQKFERYLNNKYDDRFEFVKRFGSKTVLGDRYENAYCRSEKYPDTLVTVIYDTKTKEWYENYIDVKYEKSLEHELNAKLSSVFNGSYFYIEPTKDTMIMTGGAGQLNANMSFNEYLLNRGISVIVYAEINREENIEEIKSRLEKEMKGQIYCDDILIYFFDNYDKKIETDSSYANKIIVEDNYMQKLVFEMSDVNTIIISELEKR